jgi:hypothetical protein
MTLLSRLIGFLTLSLAAFSANATVYNVSESWDFGTISNVNGALVHFYEFSSSSVPDIFSTSLTTTINNANQFGLDPTSCDSGCSFNQVLKNNIGTLFGTFKISSLSFNPIIQEIPNFDDPANPIQIFLGTSISLSGITTFTGGTGLFEGATGSGTFNAFESFDFPPYPTSLFATYTVTTLEPIPEPEYYTMLITGLGVMGFVARRRKYKQV